MKRHKRRRPSPTLAKATPTLRKKLSQAKVTYDVTTASRRRSAIAPCSMLPRLAVGHGPACLIQLVNSSASTLMSDYTAFWVKAANLSDAIADAGARPVHRAVVSNAKRLSKAA